MVTKTHRYVILVEDKPVARGRNLKKILDRTEKKYPNKKIIIRYEYPPGILIAVIRLQGTRK